METTQTVQAQVELNTGSVRIINGKMDPERTLAAGSLGVYLFRPVDSRTKPISDKLWALIPWSQVRVFHFDS